MNKSLIDSLNNIMKDIIKIDIKDRHLSNKNFFGDELHLQPYEVAVFLFRCFEEYGTNIYERITLEDLTLVKISDMICAELDSKQTIC